MAISDNIQAKAEAIDDERIANPEGPFPIADEVQQKATKAILGGTLDWVSYVKLFATNPDELARLIPTDGTTDGVRQQARAYLAANGMCGETTTGRLKDNVTAKLDLP